MVCPSCTHRELSASFAASAVKTQVLGSGRIDGYDEWRALMGGAIKIGRLSGIDVKVHRTFFAFIGYRASGSLAGALPVTENGGLVGMLTIEDFGHSRLLS